MVLVAERQRLRRRDPDARDVVRAHDPGRQDRETHQAGDAGHQGEAVERDADGGVVHALADGQLARKENRAAVQALVHEVRGHADRLIVADGPLAAGRAAMGERSLLPPCGAVVL